MAEKKMTAKEIAEYVVKEEGFCVGMDCNVCPAKEFCSQDFADPDAGEELCCKWMKNWLKENDCEQLQEDIRTHLDGAPEKLIDELCGVIVKHYKEKEV